MAISNVAQLNGLIPIIYKEARMTLLETPVIKNLVTKFDISGKPGNTLEIPKWGTVTAETLSEGVDMVNPQTLGTTSDTYTVGEAGAQTILTDDSIEDANEDVMKRHGRILGEEMARKDDADGVALFSGLSAGKGSAGTSYALAFFTAAQTALRNNYAKGQFYNVITPNQYHAFAQAILANSNYGTLVPAGSKIGMKFRAKEFMGVEIYEDANISVDASADAYGAMFTKECFGRVEKRGLRIEKERDASRRTWELNATTRYQYGELEDDFGIYLLFDSTEPTGA